VRNSQPRGEVQEEVTKKCNMGFYNKTVIIWKNYVKKRKYKMK
jgi:hypothetical protein